MNDPWHCCIYQLICHKIQPFILSKIEWDLTNGPLSKSLGLLNTRVEGSIQWVLLEISWIHVGKDPSWEYEDVQLETQTS